jgi:uracil-DNA glycosylase
MIRFDTRTLVFVTDPSARIVLLGNWTQCAESSPFANPAGEALAAAFREAGLVPEDYRSLTTVQAIAGEWEASPWLGAALRTFQPPEVVCLGMCAARVLLGPDALIPETVGQARPAPWAGGQIRVTRSPLAALAHGQVRSQRAFAHIVGTLRSAAAAEALAMRAA